MSLKKRLAVGVLSLSATGLIGIASYEGFSEKAYIPIKGDVPTIGFGSTEGGKMGDPSSPAQQRLPAKWSAEQRHPPAPALMPVSPEVVFR